MATDAADRVVQHLRRTALRQDWTGLSDGELMELYVSRRHEDAFEALLRRHGPMVLGVCRRILRNQAEAEDAFQATFLVFLRKASSIRSRATVSNWLYGVAHNTARKALALVQKRRIKEHEAGTAPRDDARAEVWQELQTLLHAELTRLPEKYRAPIVLCDLEGKTIKAAAHLLGWPQGTVATRLTRGRARLARRLTEHGLTFSGSVMAAAIARETALASLPPALLASTSKAASLFAASGQYLAAGAVAARVAALADGVMNTMMLVKLRLIAAVALMLGLSGAGAVIFSGAGAAGHRTHASSSSMLMQFDSDVQYSRSAALVTQAIEPGRVTKVSAPIARSDETIDNGLGKRDAQRDWKLPRFDDLFVKGRVKVDVTNGPEQHVSVHGAGALVGHLEPRVMKHEKMDRLVLELNDQAEKANAATAAIEVSVTIPRLSSVIAEGTAVVEYGGVEAASLTVAVSGSAKVGVAGASMKLVASAKDSGQIDAAGLAAGEVTVTASGKSSCAFHPVHLFNVLSSGESRLEYIGKPTQIQKITSDRSTVVGR
jgi:RNA polymerase sigma factor (sigma-70 family)